MQKRTKITRVVAALFASLFGLLRLQDVTTEYVADSAWIAWLAYVPMVMQAVLILAADNLYRQVGAFIGS